MRDFVEELKRRNVVRVGIAYVVIAWLVAQVAELFLDSFEAPAWVMKSLLLLLTLGLPVALFFAWAFELTPEGIKKEEDVDRSQSVTRKTGRRLDRAIIIVLALALAYFVTDKFFLGKDDPAIEANAPLATAEQQTPASAVPSIEERSVAVLPFVNMSPDPEQEYFSDGITEEIINAVVKIPGVSVPARTSVFGFKNFKGDVREVGESLGVAHVLEGSVRSQGDQVRITAQLIRVENGFHLWSETFDRKLENIFAVQEEIAAAIAGELVGKLGVELETVPNKTRNMAAYDTYLRGRDALRRREDVAIELLQRVTEQDPDFAPGWAALAIAYQSITTENEKTIAAAQQALALDPKNVDALNAMGATLRDDRRWLEAEAYFDRALGIDPNSAELLEDYAEFLGYVGRTEEALVVTTRGMEIDSNLFPLMAAHVEALASNGKGDEAIKWIQELLAEQDPGETPYWWWNLLEFWLSPAPEVVGFVDPEPPPLPDNPPPRWAELVALGKRILKDPNDVNAIARLKTNYQALVDKPVADAGITEYRLLLIKAGAIDAVIATDIANLDKPGFFMYEGVWMPFYQDYRQHPRFPEYLERTGIIDYWNASKWPKWCNRNQQGDIACK